jgi:hypothetical protein
MGRARVQKEWIELPSLLIESENIIQVVSTYWTLVGSIGMSSLTRTKHASTGS